MIKASVRIDDARDERFHLLRLHWEGRIAGRLGGTAELIVTEHVTVDPDSLVGKPLILDFVEDESHREGSTPAAVIRAIAQDYDLADGRQILRVQLEPLFIALGVEEHCCTYGDKTVQEIITEVLERNGLVGGRDFAFRLGDDAYPRIPFVAQFDESDLAFVQRLAEHWGISTGLEPRGGARDLMVFADDPRAFSAIPTQTLPYVDSGYRFGVTRLTREVNALPAEVVLLNYVHDWPEQGLQVAQKVAFGTAGRQVEHDHNFRSTDGDGKLLATIRAEELSSGRVVYSGEAASAALRAGQLCTITGHPAWGDLKLLITSAVLDFENAPLMQGAGAIPVLTVAFTAMPLDLDGVPMRYRPPRRTPKPRIRGVLHGRVEDSEDRLNRQLDGEGSYRVQLLAHGSDSGPVRALYPRVRMAQPTGGAGAGMHFPLHPGTEVLLAFVDGDPDRPFICGTVPNPRDRSPVDERSATKNILQTAAGSRLEFDDGLLAAAAGGAVSGDGVTGKIHVPWEASRTGSYLRLGRADDREAAESRGPGSAQAWDGWYDFTNGRRTSVTMGASMQVVGGQHTIREYGDVFRVKYANGLSPLAAPGAASAQAGASGDAGGQAAQADDREAEAASFVTVQADYASGLLQNTVKVQAVNSSTYTTGSIYDHTTGYKSYTTTGMTMANNLSLQFSNTVGMKVSFDQALAIGVTRGWKIAADTAKSWSVGQTQEVSAADKVTISLRDRNTAQAAARAHTTFANVATALSVALLANEVTMRGVLAAEEISGDGDDFEKATIKRLDRVGGVFRGVVTGAALLEAIVAAIVFVHYARKKAEDALGVGPVLQIEPERASLMAGRRTGPSEVAVTADGVAMLSGSMISRSEVRATGDSVLISSGKVALPSYIEIKPRSITLTCGPTRLVVSPTGLRCSGQWITDLPAAPMPPDPPIDELDGLGALFG